MLIDDLKLKLKKEYPGLWDDDQGITLDQIVELVAREVCREIKEKINKEMALNFLGKQDEYQTLAKIEDIINQGGGSDG